LVRNLGRYQVDVTPYVPADPDVPFFGHWKQARHMVDVAKNRAAPLVTRGEALNVINALEGLYRSAEAGREVTLD
jgi:predicted dehydrogenase